MTAIEFVRKEGWNVAHAIVVGIPEKFMSCYYSKVCWCDKAKKYSDQFIPRESLVNMASLKRLVDSFETVGMWGGLPAAKAHLESLADRCTNGGLESVRGQYKTLKQAIADVESVGGGV